MSRIRALLFLLFPSLVCSACFKGLGVDRLGYERVYEELTANALSGKAVSLSTREVLHRYDLTERFEDDAAGTLATLHERVCVEADAKTLFALSEISYYLGERKEDRGYYALSAIYAYFCLFGTDAPPPSPYDRRFRVACDLYNRGMAQAGRPEGDEPIRPRSGRFELPIGWIDIAFERIGFPWGADQFDRFLPADQYSVRGLSWRVREPGLGVPLVALRNDDSESLGEHTPPNLRLPATAFLRVEGGVRDLANGLRGTVELHRPFDSVSVAERSVPLESDVTTPLAHMLEERSGLLLGIGRLFNPEADSPPGIYQLQPYERGKIPVVFVHGTASSPSTWAEMFNGLTSDPYLRDHFQFWFFLYTTGNPVPYSAALLREALTELRSEIDPEGTDEALDHMVVVGHSQGGMLVRLVVTQSGDRFWQLVPNADEIGSVDDMDVDEETRALLRRVLFFEPVPFVDRVVFLSTPHRGSFVAGGWIGRFVKKRIDQALDIRQTFKDLFERGVIPKELAEDMPTSIDNMTADNRFVQILAASPFPPDVKIHSIIAVQDDAPLDEATDGVVAYTSAHLDEADSELIVRSGHSVQDRAPAILEVRRILRVHETELAGPREAPEPAETAD